MEIVTKPKREFHGMDERLQELEHRNIQKREERHYEPEYRKPYHTFEFWFGFGTMALVALWLIVAALFLPCLLELVMPRWTDWLMLMVAMGMTGLWSVFLIKLKVI